jgi:hypothetical protein
MDKFVCFTIYECSPLELVVVHRQPHSIVLMTAVPHVHCPEHTRTQGQAIMLECASSRMVYGVNPPVLSDLKCFQPLRPLSHLPRLLIVCPETVCLDYGSITAHFQDGYIYSLNSADLNKVLCH